MHIDYLDYDLDDNDSIYEFLDNEITNYSEIEQDDYETELENNSDIEADIEYD